MRNIKFIFWKYYFDGCALGDLGAELGDQLGRFFNNK